MKRLGQPVSDSQTFARLLKARFSVGVIGMTHGEDEIVVGHDRLHAIGQSLNDFFEEGCRVGAGALGANAGYRFAAKIVHGRVSIFPRTVSPAIEILQIQVQQFAGTAFFIAVGDARLRRRKRLRPRIDSTRCTLLCPMCSIAAMRAGPQPRPRSCKISSSIAVARRLGERSGRRERGCSPARPCS